MSRISFAPSISTISVLRVNVVDMVDGFRFAALAPKVTHASIFPPESKSNNCLFPFISAESGTSTLAMRSSVIVFSFQISISTAVSALVAAKANLLSKDLFHTGLTPPAYANFVRAKVLRPGKSVARTYGS